jgi:hypothetical protein
VSRVNAPLPPLARVGVLTRLCVCSQSVLANVLVKLSGAAAAHFGLPLTKAEAVVQLAPPSPSAWDHVQGQWRSTLLAALLLSLWGEERGASGMPAVHVHTSLMFNSHACSCSRHCRMVHLQCLRGSGVQQEQRCPRGCTPVRICHHCEHSLVCVLSPAGLSESLASTTRTLSSEVVRLRAGSQHDASASCHLQNDGRAAVSSCGASGFRHGVLCMPCDAVPDFTDGVLTGRWASTQGDLPSVVDQL